MATSRSKPANENDPSRHEQAVDVVIKILTGQRHINDSVNYWYQTSERVVAALEDASLLTSPPALPPASASVSALTDTAASPDAA